MSEAVSHPTGHSMLSARSLRGFSAARAARWRPGLGDVSHSEIFATGRDASGGALALALAMDALRQADRGPTAEVEDRRAVLWVQDRASIRLTGRPYRHGLPQSLRHRVVHVVAEKVEDALFAIEEGLRCRDLAFVVGEVAGNPKALDFTASRRLSLASEKHGVPLWLVRLDAQRDLSAARLRWQVKAAASRPPQWNRQAPGEASWHAELFRARSHPPGEWILSDDGHKLIVDRDERPAAAPHPVGLAFASGGRSLAG